MSLLSRIIPFFLYSLYFINVASAFSNDVTVHDDECRLRCWLSHLRIHVPLEPIGTPIGTLVIQNFTCYDLQLGAINSDVDRQQLQLSVGAHDIGVACDAVWHTEAVISFKGTMAVRLSNDSHVQGRFVFDRTADGRLVRAARFDECEPPLTELHIGYINVTASFVPQKIIDTVEQFARPFIESELSTQVCTQIGELVRVNLTDAFGSVNERLEPFLWPELRDLLDPPPGNTLPLYPNNSAIGLLDYFADEVFNAHRLNTVVDMFTNGTGQFVIDKAMLGDMAVFAINFTLPSGVSMSANPDDSEAQLRVGVNNIVLGDLNSWNVWDILTPSSVAALQWFSGMESLTFNVSLSINVTVPSADSESAHTAHLHERALALVTLNQLELLEQSAIYLDNDLVNELSAGQRIVPGCWLATLNNASVASVRVNASLDALSIVPLDGDVEVDIDELIDNVVMLFASSFSEALPAVLNAFGSAPVADAANAALAAAIDEATNMTTCPTPQEAALPDPFEFDPFNYVVSSAVGLLVAVSLFVTTCACVCRLKRAGDDAIVPPRSINSEALTDNLDSLSLNTPLLVDRILNEHHARLAAYRSLSSSARVHWLARLLMPIALCGNIALFVASNLSVGAGVYLTVRTEQTETRLPSLFAFTLANSVRDMWDAQVYPLSILICVFSGIWPYLKLVLMLACWHLPRSVLGTRLRGSLLVAIDALGKWSLIDAYVLVIMMVAFRVEIAAPAMAAAGTAEGAAAFSAMVEPEFGFYSFLLATMTSLIWTHIMLAYHRRDVDDLGAELARSKRAQPLSLMPMRWRGVIHLWTCGGRLLVALLLVISLGFMLAGAAVDSFDLTFGGAAALMYEWIGMPVRRHFSLLTLGLAFPDAVNPPPYFGIYYIQVVFLLFAFVLPLLHLLVMLLLWCVPMRRVMQRSIYVASEVLYAWSALDVFVVSIIVALVQLRQFARFIVGDRCELIDRILDQYVDKHYYTEDPECFSCTATLRVGCWLLFVGAFVYTTVSLFMMRSFRSSFALDKERRRSSRKSESIKKLDASDLSVQSNDSSEATSNYGVVNAAADAAADSSHSCCGLLRSVK